MPLTIKIFIEQLHKMSVFNAVDLKCVLEEDQLQLHLDDSKSGIFDETITILKGLVCY